MTKLKFRLIAFATAALTLSSVAFAAEKPTVVLVYGAFAEPSSWNGVVANLQKQGYPVVAIANPLRSLAADADYVASLVKQTSGPVVLVGHS